MTHRIVARYTGRYTRIVCACGWFTVNASPRMADRFHELHAEGWLN